MSGKTTLLVTLTLTLSLTATAETWYVDKNNTSGTEDGQTWETAYTTIQPAIDTAHQAGGGEVWIAQGIYDEPRDNDTGSVIMKEDVHIYGGFPGPGSDWDNRDWKTYVTSIDGTTSRNGEQAYHVIVGAEDTILDGFTVTGGNADVGGGYSYIDTLLRGAGMLNEGVSLVVRNCRFRDNRALVGGGGMYCRSASVEVTNCLFERNQSVYQSTGTGGHGGGLQSSDSTVVIKNSIFRENKAGQSGAAIDSSGENISIVNCTFIENATSDMDYDSGGALYIKSAVPSRIANCIFWKNVPRQIYVNKYSEAEPVVNFCDVEGGYPGEGNIDEDPLFVNVYAGDLRLLPSSPCVDAGTSEGAPETGFAGNPRPLGLRVDMGAFEGPESYLDQDGDGIPDAGEGATDPDSDGIPNYLDLDSDDDGISDNLEGANDPDGDRIPSNTDLDSDGDGILDNEEGAFDTDGDGVSDHLDADSDGDGFHDAYEGSEDDDSDGLPNYRDLDSDGDGVPDSEQMVQIIYVDKDNVSGEEDGLSWQTSFDRIQPAIDKALYYFSTSTPGQPPVEVWVAEGTYDEFRPDNEWGSVIMSPGVHLYGGFEGTKTDRADRDWRSRFSVIDGLTSRDGHRAEAVILGADDAVLDGFTVTQGEKGMYNRKVSPLVANCLFQDNSMWGMYNIRSLPVIVGCVFQNHVLEFTGGGMFNYDSAVAMANCLFRENISTGYRRCTGSPPFVTCWDVAGDGGGMQNDRSTVLVDNCTFVNNHPGGIVGLSPGDVLISRSQVQIRNSIFWGHGGQLLGGDTSVDYTVTYSDVQGGYAGEGNIAADPMFVDAEGGDFRLMEGSPCIDAGSSVEGVVEDLEGDPRPMGLGFDMGADEFRSDSDGDGYTDWEEIEYGGDPLATSVVPEPWLVSVTAETDSETIWSRVWTQLSVSGDMRDGSSADMGSADVSWTIVSGPGEIDSVTGEFTGEESGEYEVFVSVVLDGVEQTDTLRFSVEQRVLGDVDLDGVATAVDVQLVINGVLGLDAPATCDLDGNDKVDASDIQLVINAALGLDD